MQEKDSAELLLALKVAEQFPETRHTCGQLPAAVGQVRETDSPPESPEGSQL